ncbi:RNA 2',3'-cyclic phosphodiesterase [Sphingomicrobium astaxanthinifaciens]|uniref:RNA 2',3'-cyclic phosphodiesterase n=1 Tax=Sphingomicrobium astaxanthinifaciens TaxID=1227949 RepID=UPI001FCABE11|nr:RNA 2',3'-cyclic phosphodiesterase [Sphingomicrobium astaxanthinifaciens]MCJ7420613.1 RNA 2',3'-cyclic phosphodiesterase [Sphingomicrobium astaxanthinifaciens]
MHRLFVALPLPDTLVEALAPAMEGGPEGLRWVPEDHLHCTLRFIGEVERPLAEMAAGALVDIVAAPLEVRVEGVGVFDHRRHGALWARLVPKAPLKALHEKVDRALQHCGLPPERRAYLPHVTLARWSGGALDPRGWTERWAGLASPAVRLERFVLFESQLGRHGPTYHEVASVRLG